MEHAHAGGGVLLNKPEMASPGFIRMSVSRHASDAALRREGRGDGAKMAAQLRVLPLRGQENTQGTHRIRSRRGALGK